MRCFTGLGQDGAGNARGAAYAPRPEGRPKGRTLRPRPRKHGLTLSLGDESPLGESREWNAGRRARLARREPHRWVRRIRISVFRRSASLFCAHDLVRKPDTTLGSSPRASFFGIMRDGKRIILVVCKPRARSASRERDFYFVIAGLDPAIHAAAKLVQILRVVSLVSLQHEPPGHRRAKRRRSSNGYARW